MYDIVTFGSATRDIIIQPKKVTGLKYEKHEGIGQICLPMGSKIDVEQFHFTSGGGGTNAATTFANYGLRVGYCGSVGKDDAADEIKSELKQSKIVSFIVQKAEKPTNQSVVILNTGHDKTIFAYRGAAELLQAGDIPFGKLKTKWLYVAPLSGLLCDEFSGLVSWAKERGIKIAANPGMAQLSLPDFAQIAKNIDVLILNQEEASFLTKIPYEQESAIFKKMDELCPGILLMTKGGAGVSVSDNMQHYWAKPHLERAIVDTTGAGDAFGSGFVAEFMQSGNIESAIQFGMANSEGCIAHIGAKSGLLKMGDYFEKVEVLKENL